MKILSLNLHSYFEARTYWCFHNVAKDIAKEKYDVVCLQEVNQLICSRLVTEEGDETIRVDNAAYVIKLILENLFQLKYEVIWTKAKVLDGLIEEGEAIPTPHKIKHSEDFVVSKLVDMNEWRRRSNLHSVIGKDGVDYNIFSVHFGWGDGKEIFEDQFDRFKEWIVNKQGKLIIAGDFNIGYNSEEYTFVMNSDLIDIGEKCSIEGYPTSFEPNGTGHRIDYILTNIDAIYSAQIKFDGEREAKVSDHYGVMAEIIEQTLLSDII